MSHGTFKIAILDLNAGHPNEGMRCIEDLVKEFLSKDSTPGTYRIFDVRVANEVPEVADFDIFISSGGPGSPLPSGEAWEPKYFAFLDAVLRHNLSHPHKKFMFLICHSFQIACLHWNLADVTKRRSTAFGIYPIHKTEPGRYEPILEGLDDPFYGVDSRDYQVVLPKKGKLRTLEGEVLCREKIRPHVALERAVMAIRFTREIVGVQFHPEADSEGMRRYFNRADKRKLIVKRYGKEKYLDMMAHLDDEDKIMRTNHTIIPRFLDLAVLDIRESKQIAL